MAASGLIIEEAGLGRRRGGGRWCQTQVAIGLGADQAAPGRSLDKTLLEKEGFNHVLHRVPGFGDGIGEGLDARRPAAVVVDQGP